MNLYSASDLIQIPFAPVISPNRSMSSRLASSMISSRAKALALSAACNEIAVSVHDGVSRNLNFLFILICIIIVG